MGWVYLSRAKYLLELTMHIFLDLSQLLVCYCSQVMRLLDQILVFTSMGPVVSGSEISGSRDFNRSLTCVVLSWLLVPLSDSIIIQSKAQELSYADTTEKYPILEDQRELGTF